MGVKKGTFDKTVRIVRREEKKRRKTGGAKRKLSIEKMVKMMFEYYRQYRTYYQIGDSYNVSESCAYRTIKYVEEVLMSSGEYALDGKNGLLKEGIEVAVIDATEIGIERPKKNSEMAKAGRKRDIQ